uniref:Uncharacterized protein n=1 Tax=Candidatus Kentrum sp. TC TaxID=2126339 RepID=A0A450YFK3_9GAMM|nr:MAG: hypothetical protein BECKTC1821D_GA0114238_100941 [Candidatus Kentron sp. TC]
MYAFCNDNVILRMFCVGNTTHSRGYLPCEAPDGFHDPWHVWRHFERSEKSFMLEGDAHITTVSRAVYQQGIAPGWSEAQPRSVVTPTLKSSPAMATITDSTRQPGKHFQHIGSLSSRPEGEISIKYSARKISPFGRDDKLLMCWKRFPEIRPAGASCPRPSLAPSRHSPAETGGQGWSATLYPAITHH